jgi:hypothetical protein
VPRLVREVITLDDGDAADVSGQSTSGRESGHPGTEDDRARRRAAGS